MSRLHCDHCSAEVGPDDDFRCSLGWEGLPPSPEAFQDVETRTGVPEGGREREAARIVAAFFGESGPSLSDEERLSYGTALLALGATIRVTCAKCQTEPS
jgi:hypothetical protein